MSKATCGMVTDIVFKASAKTYIPNNGNLLKIRERFAYHFLDNGTMYKYAKFDQNITCGFRVMSFFTERHRHRNEAQQSLATVLHTRG